MLNPYSPADLLGAGLYHEDHQVCQVHRAWHRPPAATLLHHRAAGAAVRTPAGCGDQCHPGQGECSCVSVGMPPSLSLKRKCDSVIIDPWGDMLHPVMLHVCFSCAPMSGKSCLCWWMYGGNCTSSNV